MQASPASPLKAQIPFHPPRTQDLGWSFRQSSRQHRVSEKKKGLSGNVGTGAWSQMTKPPQDPSCRGTGAPNVGWLPPVVSVGFLGLPGCGEGQRVPGLMGGSRHSPD